MRLTVMGSSDAFNSGGRGSSCYWVEGSGWGPVMIDFGPTAMCALQGRGRDPRDLRAIVVTHLHGDHIGGLPFLVLDGMFNRERTTPLDIIGPIGSSDRIETICHAAYTEIEGREKPYELRVKELAPGATADVARVTIETWAAMHMDPPDQPLCLRLTSPSGKVVAFSGDTEVCDGLFEAIRGADLAVVECTGVDPPIGRHCTWEDWRVELPRTGAKRVLLTHANEDMRARWPELRKDMPAGMDVDLADDGMVIDF